jgi:hypothetical protein
MAAMIGLPGVNGLPGFNPANATESRLLPNDQTEYRSDYADYADYADRSKADLTGEDQQIAQFFPYASTEEQVIMVQGLGTAFAPAETAAIEFVLVNYDPYYDPYACTYGSEGGGTSTGYATDPTAVNDTSSPQACPPPPEPVAITRSALQPVVEALTAAGISVNKISVRLPGDESDSYAAYYYTDSASVLLTLDHPSRQQVVDLVTAVENVVAGNEAVYLQDRYVQYTLSEAGCNALETEAYREAVANARDRAAVLAEALGVDVGNVPSVADSSAAPFSLTALTAAAYPSYCDADVYSVTYGSYYPSPSYYDSSLPAEVRVQRGVYVTYPVRGQ